MPQTARKIGFVSAACAAIGVLLAWGAKLQFNFGLWIVFVGGLASGGLAWLMYDFAGVIAGVKQAWSDLRGWEPDRKKFKRFFKIWSHTTVIASGPLSWAIGTLYFICFGFYAQGDQSPEIVAFVGLSVFVLFFMGMMSAALLEDPDIDIGRLGKGALIMNPVVFPFTAIYCLAKGLIWLAPKVLCRIATFFTFLIQLLARAFILIHSEERRICFTAAMIGSMFGLMSCYFHGQAFFGALIGAVVGGALGHLEYRFGKRLAAKLEVKYLKQKGTAIIPT